jgi:hypothetical protein
MKKFAAMACLGLLVMGAQAAEPEAPVRIFGAGELALSQYSVIERLWTGTWRSAFWLPAYGDAAAAISALTAEAERRGADGVVNLHCLRDGGGWVGGYICYGLAIKLKQ